MVNRIESVRVVKWEYDRGGKGKEGLEIKSDDEPCITRLVSNSSAVEFPRKRSCVPKRRGSSAVV